MKGLATCFFLLLSLVIFAQNDIGSIVIVTTIDGSVIKGKISESDDDKMTLVTSYGKAEIRMVHVKKVSYQISSPEPKETKKAPLNTNPLGDNNYSASHYLFSSSAYGLQKGESYYENTYLVWNTLGVGFSDNFSINFSGKLISPLLFENLPVIAIAPKFSLPFKNKGAFSLSGTLFSFPNGSDDSEYGGFVNAGFTLGSRLNNITFNAAIGYAYGYGFELNDLQPFSISTMFKISDRLSFVSENWIFNGDNFLEGAYSINLRYHFVDNRSSFTFGLWRPTEDTDPLLAIPFASGLIGF